MLCCEEAHRLTLARVTSAGPAEAMVPPKEITWPSTTTSHFEPCPLFSSVRLKLSGDS